MPPAEATLLQMPEASAANGRTRSAAKAQRTAILRIGNLLFQLAGHPAGVLRAVDVPAHGDVVLLDDLRWLAVRSDERLGAAVGRDRRMVRAAAQVATVGTRAA